MNDVPYTTSTGIKMGSRWLEARRPMEIDDPDMLYLQKALIYNKDLVRGEKLNMIVTCISFAVLIGVIVAVFLLGKS